MAAQFLLRHNVQCGKLFASWRVAPRIAPHAEMKDDAMTTIKHPEVGPDGWELKALVYPGSPSEIAVGILEKDGHKMLGLRWCAGDETSAPWSGRETDWFLVPFTFASAIGRSLAQLHATGHAGIDADGFRFMAEWLIEDEGLDDAMCY